MHSTGVWFQRPISFHQNSLIKFLHVWNMHTWLQSLNSFMIFWWCIISSGILVTLHFTDTLCVLSNNAHFFQYLHYFFSPYFLYVNQRLLESQPFFWTKNSQSGTLSMPTLVLPKQCPNDRIVGFSWTTFTQITQNLLTEKLVF